MEATVTIRLDRLRVVEVIVLDRLDKVARGDVVVMELLMNRVVI